MSFTHLPLKSRIPLTVLYKSPLLAATIAFKQPPYKVKTSYSRHELHEKPASDGHHLKRMHTMLTMAIHMRINWQRHSSPPMHAVISTYNCLAIHAPIVIFLSGQTVLHKHCTQAVSILFNHYESKPGSLEASNRATVAPCLHVYKRNLWLVASPTQMCLSLTALVQSRPDFPRSLH